MRYGLIFNMHKRIRFYTYINEEVPFKRSLAKYIYFFFHLHKKQFISENYVRKSRSSVIVPIMDRITINRCK